MSTKNTVPKHIAIIMDGNGRWAKSKKLPRIAGHKKGAEVVKLILKACDAKGIKFLTLYTFSSENWKRPENEVNFLMKLLSNQLEKGILLLSDNNVKFLTIGKIDAFAPSIGNIIQKAKDDTKNNTGITLILALNYGARREIVDAAVSLCGDISAKKLSLGAVTEEVFSKYMYTKEIPDPELLIRTSGEMRLSNFLLWQLSYSEIYITDKFWPDFDIQELEKALLEFSKRERRFGGI